MKKAIVLLAHGARDPEWARPIEAMAARLRNLLPDTRVALAFLELMAPDIETAMDMIVKEDARQIRVVPVFLAQGGHVKRDLPTKVEALRTKFASSHPDLTIELEPAIGEQGEVIDAIARSVARIAGKS
ncbi:MAG: sirohydrochlorin chelatase [Burkholderiales bacterium]